MSIASRWLMTIALSVTAVFACAKDNNSLLVGEHKLTESALKAVIGTKGKILGKTSEGLFRVAPIGKTTLKELSKALGAKVEHVFPGTANLVDPSSLFSVRDHIEYKETAYEIRTGREPEENEAEELGVDFYEALEWYLAVRADPATGKVDRDAYMDGARHRDQMPPANAAMLDPGVKHAGAPAAWAQFGPYEVPPPYRQYYGTGNTSGRKNGIAHSPTNHNVTYLASAGGGIWKSNNNAVSYSPLSDKWQYLHTTCVAVDPTNENIVYAGTGDYYGFFTQLSFGIMKSTDGGATWTNYGGADFGDSVVTRIKISKQNPNILVALTAGPTGDIWRSTNAGVTWARTNAPDGNWDDIDSSFSDVTWLAVSGSMDVVYMSLDEGATWTARTTPAGAGGSLWDIAESKGPDAGSFNRTYLITSNRHVYKSTDRGGTWTDVTAAFDAASSNASYNWSQSSYDIYITTGPNAAGTGDIVVAGLISVQVSDDNATTWTDASRSFETNSKWHNDQHCAEWYDGQPGWFWLGGDGGLSFLQWNETTNVGTFIDTLNEGIYDQQFYKIAVHPTDSSRVMGGTQDNASPASYGATGASAWVNLYAGDGTGQAFDRANPAIHYSGGQNSTFYRYASANTLTNTYIGPGSGPFVTPLVCAGPAGSTVFCGGNGSLREWTGVGTTWTNHALPAAGTIQDISVSKFGTTRMYLSATNGNAFRTNDSGATFTQIDGTTLPAAAIGGMAESPFTTDYLIAGLQRVGNPAVVWRTTNAAVATPTWTNISGTGLTALPSLPVNDVERDPFTSVYYAATDVGVFVSPDQGQNWYNMNAMGMPNCAVNDLWIYSSGGTNFLYAGTFGRGIWRCFLSDRKLSSIQIAKPAIYGGQQNTITLKMNGAAPVGSVVTLSDTSANVSIPTSATIPLGATQYTFNCFTTNPTSDQTVTIFGTVYGNTTSNSFTLHAIPAFTYTPESANIYGGNRFNATIDFTIPCPITAVFTFSDNAVQVASPAATSIAAGGQTKVVPLYTASVAATVNAVIQAKLANTTASSSVAIQPRPDLSNLSLSPASVVGGNSSTGTITMNFAGAAGPQTVTTSDTSAIVTTPSSVVVPGGASTANFNITTNVVTASYNVTVKARLRGITKAATLNVHP